MILTATFTGEPFKFYKINEDFAFLALDTHGYCYIDF